MHLSAIIFDFDGVIADTERLHLRAFREVLAGLGVDLTEADYYARYLGFNDGDVLRSVARDCGLAPDDARLVTMLREKAARYARLVAAEPVLYAGVEQRVREWSRQVPLAIASGALRSEIDLILGRSNLAGCFAAIVTAADVARGKPAPDSYLAALAALNSGASGRAEGSPHGRESVSQTDSGIRTPAVGLPAIAPTTCVVIEDSPPGIQAAKAAGMRTVAVTTNHAARLLAGADLVVASVAALDLRMLEAVGS